MWGCFLRSNRELTHFKHKNPLENWSSWLFLLTGQFHNLLVDSDCLNQVFLDILFYYPLSFNTFSSPLGFTLISNMTGLYYIISLSLSICVGMCVCVYKILYTLHIYTHIYKILYDFMEYQSLQLFSLNPKIIQFKLLCDDSFICVYMQKGMEKDYLNSYLIQLFNIHCPQSLSELSPPKHIGILLYVFISFILLLQNNLNYGSFSCYPGFFPRTETLLKV